MRFLLPMLSAALALTASCRNADIVIEEKISSMSLREKAGQLVIIRAECLSPSIKWEETTELPQYKIQRLTDEMIATARDYPVGGVLLYGHNIDNPKQLKAFTKEIHALPGAPFLCIDEEGGRVSRIGGNPNFDVPRYESTASIGKSGNPKKARECAESIGKYLKEYGFDIDFAPVADVNTNPENIVIGNRAFSDSPEVAAKMVAAFVEGMDSKGIASCLKHFPGHGDTRTDTHEGYAVSLKDQGQLLACEMIPFISGIQAGVPMIMTAHVSLPKLTGSDIPSTLSPLVLKDLLRDRLGFKGIIITDAIEMGAIKQHYSTRNATVMAICAGADIVLCPRDYREAVDAITDAVNEGVISEERLDESLRRVLALKYKFGLLK
ncbi:MAG: glycoside hydrolase family 3 protein [Bacteroidales bacterium]|nr:glycoside hydrolase family 3 protein [Bacteroidales bacterium]